MCGHTSRPRALLRELLLFLLLLLLLSRLAVVRGQDCVLQPHQLSNKRVYALNSGRGWHVLHHDHVPSGEVLQLVCNETDSVAAACHNGRFSVPLPQQNCERRLRPKVAADRSDEQCRRLGGLKYQVRYELHNSKLPLYEVCYDGRREQALYARHRVYRFGVSPADYRRPQFKQGREVSAERRNSFEKTAVYDTFRRLLGEDQTFIPSPADLFIERGHLAPAADFVTPDQMDATFRYLNVVPQFGRSNRSNWKRLEMWVRKLPTEADADTDADVGAVDVVTGAFGILELPHSENLGRLVPMFLVEGNRNPIPLWLYKVVRHAGRRCTAVVTLNNQFSPEGHLRPEQCSAVACPGDLKFSNESASGISYCCDYQHFASRMGDHVRLC